MSASPALELPPPKVFVSYSWTPQENQERVIEWAKRLLADGVDVVLDVFDLKEGQDKYVFMEKMVTDPSVSHVLVICDREYVKKADSRKAGVGTESQIISREVYERVEQTKFIPIVCQFGDQRQPYLPHFFKSRIWIDFSSPESVNENWEKLVRLLFGKPVHQKPQIGAPPVYITSAIPDPPNVVASKFESFKQVLLSGKYGVSAYRARFLDACISYADELRIRKSPDLEGIAKRVLEDCGKLKSVRDFVVDWILLESDSQHSSEFSDCLLEFLERLRDTKARPPELGAWNESWFEAHAIFLYEVFLFIVAALLKTHRYDVLRDVFHYRYLAPASSRQSRHEVEDFSCFLGTASLVQSELSSDGTRYLSPAAEVIKRQSDRKDIPFAAVVEADLLSFLMSLIVEGSYWYPQMMYYSQYNVDFPFFTRAANKKWFDRLAVITGIKSAENLREIVKKKLNDPGILARTEMRFYRSAWDSMNMKNLGSLE